MRIDCHVHVSAVLPGHGCTSPRLMRSVPFRYLRWCTGIKGQDEASERAVEACLVGTVEGTPELDAAVVLAFDAVYTPAGAFDQSNTHLYVTNDYALELSRRHRKLLFGASVHPYRRDAVAQIERVVAGGAVLLKWLPIVQNFNPADPRCIPVYEALAHYGLPLLSHTGGEQALPNLDKSVASPALLEPALKRGVTVIAAHCGTGAAPFERSYLDEFAHLAHEYEHFYGDTSALNLPMRWKAYSLFARDAVVRSKLVHGSDWPIPCYPPPRWTGLRGACAVMRERNWMRRDVLIKQRLGLFDEAYWMRAAKVLRLPDWKRVAGQVDPPSETAGFAGRSGVSGADGTT